MRQKCIYKLCSRSNFNQLNVSGEFSNGRASGNVECLESLFCQQQAKNVVYITIAYIAAVAKVHQLCSLIIRIELYKHVRLEKEYHSIYTYV